jgi:tetratricopeptide (TPR) repeat protein
VKKITIFLLIFYMIPQLNASVNDDASSYYKAQNYDKALEIYKNLNDDTNPYILYNMANCYYKLNDKTNAMIYYLKAFKLKPRDKNIRENLITVAKQNGETIFSEDIPQFLYRIYYFFSDLELKAISELFFFLLVLLIIINTHKKDDKLHGYIILSVLIFGIFFISYIMRKNSYLSNIAVTIYETELYSGPDKTFNSLAIIPKGKIIKVISDDENYLEVGVPKDNIKGWVEKNTIVKI